MGDGDMFILLRVNDQRGTFEAFEMANSDKQYDIGTKIGTSETAFRTAFETADGVKKGEAVPFLDKAETRAAVALLTRSIRIVSAGDKIEQPFPDETTNYMYGGHVVFRQGFKQLQIQGVEFKQLGQGGLLGRYPVHFHVARQVPADTYIIDSSVNEFDDAVVCAALDIGRHVGSKRRLQVDRSWLLPGRRNRDRQQVLFQHRH